MTSICVQLNIKNFQAGSDRHCPGGTAPMSAGFCPLPVYLAPVNEGTVRYVKDLRLICIAELQGATQEDEGDEEDNKQPLLRETVESESYSTTQKTR